MKGEYYQTKEPVQKYIKLAKEVDGKQRKHIFNFYKVKNLNNHNC